MDLIALNHLACTHAHMHAATEVLYLYIDYVLVVCICTALTSPPPSVCVLTRAEPDEVSSEVECEVNDPQ